MGKSQGGKNQGISVRPSGAGLKERASMAEHRDKRTKTGFVHNPMDEALLRKCDTMMKGLMKRTLAGAPGSPPLHETGGVGARLSTCLEKRFPVQRPRVRVLQGREGSERRFREEARGDRA